jgi:hypothetical protein
VLKKYFNVVSDSVSNSSSVLSALSALINYYYFGEVITGFIFVHFSEMMEFNNKARLEMTRQLEDMRETMRKERIGAISTELSIDAENECLKFDVHSLSSNVTLFLSFEKKQQH